MHQTDELPRVNNSTSRPIPIESPNAQLQSCVKNPSHWWFICTSFPIFASAIELMACSFTICALVENWREIGRIDDGGETVVSISNPAWLIALTAISLVIALFATLILALDMMHLLSNTTEIKIKLFVILGWYISSIILITLVSIMSSRAHLPPQFQPATPMILSQSFYYAAIAGGIHFVAASLMLISVFGACYLGHYKEDFHASMTHPTLLLKVSSFGTYLLSGGAVFARVEGWSFLDAVYWADVTILTVGIGELTPRTHLGRSLLFPYAVGGVCVLGQMVGAIHTFCSERRRKRLRVLIAKKRWKLWKRLSSRGRYDGKARSSDLDRNIGQTTGHQIFNEREFDAMRRVQWSAASEMVRNAFLGSMMAWFMLWLFSAAVFMRAEREQGWTYFESVYFTFTSLMTIGYGDFVPKSALAKPFFVFWSLLAVPILTILIVAVDKTLFEEMKAFIRWGWRLGRLEGGVISRLAQHRKNCFQRRRPLGAEWSRGRSDSTEDPRTNVDKGKTTSQPVPERFPNKDGQGVLTKPANTANTDHDRDKNTARDRYALIEKLIDVAHDLSSSARKKHYTYNEWIQFLELFAQARGGIDALGQEESIWFISSDEGNVFGQQGWFGDHGPFMAEKSETEWVLHQITVALKRVLKQELDQRKQGFE